MSTPTTTPSFTLHEPTPSHPPKIPFGRGGAGNRTSHPAPPTSLPTTTTISPHSSPTTTAAKSTPYAHSHHSSSSTSSSSSMPHYSTGRGGAGNMHAAGEERRMFSFDEELAVEGKVGATPVYHVGRGGAGNSVVREWLGRGRKV